MYQPKVAGSGPALVVNGQPRAWSRGLSLADLLRDYAISHPAVAVELNGELVPRAEYAGTPLVPGDQVEIVTLTGGG